MELSLRKSDLKAALICAATKDVRNYLVGVYLEFIPNADGGTLTFAGTDGHILFAGTAPAVFEADEQTAPFWMTIPADAVKAAIKGKMPCVSLRSLPDGRYSLGDTIFAPIDGTFPDFRRVIPSKVSGEMAQFNPELLERAQSALRAYFQSDRQVYKLHHGGNSSSVMCGNSRDAVVVVMPVHAKAVSGDDYAGVDIPAFPQDLRKAA
jgi:DNA polymerase-3 subunit beta